MKRKIAIVLAVKVFAAPLMVQMAAGQTDSRRCHSPAWIVAYSSIALMRGKKLEGGPAVVDKLGADPCTIVVSDSKRLPSPLIDEQRGVSVLSYNSKDSCKSALGNPNNAHVKTILVDLEDWSAPAQGDDQENPKTETKQCWRLAHDLHGDQISVIAVPAMDLMYAFDPHFDGTEYQWAIHSDLEGNLATVSDGVDVQLENIEDQPDLFERTLRTMVHQIKEARLEANMSTDIPIYVGLATAVVNKHIKTDTLVNLLLEDVKRTRGLVTGYWMAIPSENLCPGCGPPNPEVAIKLLQSLGN